LTTNQVQGNVGLANMSDPRFFELGWLTQRIWT
jgi:hypothetical protein